LLETFFSIQESDAKEYIKRQMTVQEDKFNIDNIPKPSNNNEAHINEAFQHETEPDTSSPSGAESKGDVKEDIK